MSEEAPLGEAQTDDLGEAMLTAARSVVRTCMQVRPVESVLVITDPESSEVGRALYEAASEVTERILMMMMPPGHREGSEPANQVADLMRRQDVVLIATKHSMTHTRARANASREGVRIASMPRINPELFAKGGMTADYNALQKEISGLSSILRRRRDIRVTSEAGTDLKFKTGGRWILEDNGICNRPGAITNLPAGKVFVLPKEGSAEGKIVIDGSWDGVRITEPISFFIEEGIIVNIEGGDLAEGIEQKIESLKSTLRPSKANLIGTFAEFGFGMNSRAKLSGNTLEDLVYRGGVYFGFGNNMALGGTVSVPLHLRGVMMNASVSLEDIDLLVNGKVIAKVR
tara:strand:- start:594 stop:1625 length:1032 start_codon:yes stop_codon:yes gene_type:complete